jgi:peptide/nickel transport system permease protein
MGRPSVAVAMDPIAAAPAAGVPRRASRRRRALNGRILVGGGVLTAFLLMALLAPLLAPYDPLRLYPGQALASPSWSHPLGNDEFGRDVLSRLIYGARISMQVALVAIGVALAAGTLAGFVAGYYGGLADPLVMRSADVLLAIPPVLLAIGVVAMLGPSVPNLILTVAILYTPRFARVAYATTQAVREHDYVLACRALGAGNVHILRTAVLPAILPPLIVQASLALGAAMLLESGLSFIGLGAQPPTPSWGAMVSAARSIMEREPLLVLWPSLALATAILSFNILGDGVRDALDPRGRG